MKIVNCLLLLAILIFSCNAETKEKPTKHAQSQTEAVNEQFYLSLGGEKQYVEIISKDKNNPVLLFIHGGPAWPQTPQLRYYNKELAEKYTLVIWEQRGAGKNYAKHPKPANLSLDQIIKDGLELTHWLKKTYSKKKIYIAGYSWGSLIGVAMANKNPESYNAYIGIAQIVNMNKGMEISRDWLRTQAQKNNDKAALSSIDSLGTLGHYEDKLDRFFKQWILLNKYNGATFNKTSEKETEKAMAFYDDYKTYDWFKVWEYSAKALQNDMFGADITTINKLDLPVYLLQGRHDWNIPSSLAENWLNNLDAPKKEIFWFENSGHGPLEEEPKKFNSVMMGLVE